MRIFRLIPADRSIPPIDFAGDDVGSVFALAQQQTLRAADLWCDGEYLCTLQHSVKGFWIIGAIPSLPKQLHSQCLAGGANRPGDETRLP